MHCPCCHLIIDPRTAWKNSNNRFYCSEFCADSEASSLAAQVAQKEALDRQYMERLRRLLPFFRDLKSKGASSLPVGALQ
jgi:hypothetical protein